MRREWTRRERPGLEVLEGRDLPSGVVGPPSTATSFYHILPYIEQENIYKHVPSVTQAPGETRIIAVLIG